MIFGQVFGASLAADAQGTFWELHDALIDTKALADALDRHTYASALATEVDAAKEIDAALAAR